jgi:hypothetical protein
MHKITFRVTLSRTRSPVLLGTSVGGPLHLALPPNQAIGARAKHTIYKQSCKHKAHNHVHIFFYTLLISAMQLSAKTMPATQNRP